MKDCARTFTMPPFSPSEKARLEIMQLSSDPRFLGDIVIGGKTPRAMLEENKKKDILRRQEYLQIIKRNGVVDEYLTPLVVEEEELVRALEAKRQEIAELKALK